MESVNDREIFGSGGGVDDVGLVSHSVPYWARTREECRTVAAGRLVDGLPEKSRSWTQGEGGLYIVTVIYQGQQNPSDADAKLVRYSLKGSFEEEAIEANPQINELIKKYNGRVRNGRVEFDPTYIEAAASGVGLQKEDPTPKKNPMFGVEKYRKFGLIWQRTYVRATIPASVVLRVGKVIETPPGAPPELQGRSKWMVMEPSAESRGNVFEITEQYQLMDAEVPDLLYLEAEGGGEE
jgi:hypothetical protein